MRKSLVLLALLGASSIAAAQSASYTGSSQSSTWAAASVKGVGTSNSAAFASGNAGHYGSDQTTNPQSYAIIGTGGENVSPGISGGVVGNSFASGNAWVNNTSTGGGSGQALAYTFSTQTVGQLGYNYTASNAPVEPWSLTFTNVGQSSSAVEIGLGTNTNGSAWANGSNSSSFYTYGGMGSQNNVVVQQGLYGYGPTATSVYASTASSYSNAYSGGTGSSSIKGSAYSLLPAITGNPGGLNVNGAAWVYSNFAANAPQVNLAPTNAVLTNTIPN